MRGDQPERPARLRRSSSTAASRATLSELCEGCCSAGCPLAPVAVIESARRRSSWRRRDLDHESCPRPQSRGGPFAGGSGTRRPERSRASSSSPPTSPSSSVARPSCTSHDSSLTSWYCRLSDSPARTNRGACRRSPRPRPRRAPSPRASRPCAASCGSGSREARAPRRDALPAPTRRPWSSTLPAADHGTRPDDREVVSSQPAPSSASVADDGADDARARADARASAHDGVLHDTTPAASARTRSEHGEAPETRALLDRPRPGRRRRAGRAWRRDERRQLGSTSVKSAPSASPTSVWKMPLEHVAVRLEIRLGRADVEPVPRQRDPEHGAFVGEPREDLALDRDGATRRDEVEHLGLEHVEAGVDEVGVDLLRPRLLEERLDATVRGRPHEPVAARVGDRREQDRRLGARSSDGTRPSRRGRPRAASRRSARRSCPRARARRSRSHLRCRAARPRPRTRATGRRSCVPKPASIWSGR